MKMRRPEPDRRARRLIHAIVTGLRRPGLAPRLAASVRPRRFGIAGMLLITLGALVAAKAALVLGDLRQPLDGRTPEAPSEAGREPSRAVPHDDRLLEPAAGPDDEDLPADEGPSTATSASDARRPAPGTALPFDPGSLDPAELEALGELVARREALEERERELELRAALLEDVEAKLSARLSDLEALKAAIQAMIEQHDAAEEARLASLVKIYESMKPKAAAEIFDRLEMSVLLDVVSRMREGVASEIIGRMTAERAEQLTAELARRRRLPDAVGGSPAGRAGD